MVDVGPATESVADEAARLLAAYDEQLRTDAETGGAESVARHGPLRLATFAGGRGFVTYRDLAGSAARTLQRLVSEALAHYAADPRVERIEWKTRGHDVAPGLHEALQANGFVAQDTESVMLGRAELLADGPPLPAGVTVRRVTDDADVRAVSALTDRVFGDAVSDDAATALLRRLSRDDGTELWVAEADGQPVGAGRLEPVSGSDFAGLWGGVTREDWRGRGIYRALTACRAQSALRIGRSLLHSDSTEHSRPILERSGLLRVSTTTPYLWHR